MDLPLGRAYGGFLRLRRSLRRGGGVQVRRLVRIIRLWLGGLGFRLVRGAVHFLRGNESITDVPDGPDPRPPARRRLRA